MAWCSHGTIWLENCSPCLCTIHQGQLKACTLQPNRINLFRGFFWFFFWRGGHFGLDDPRGSAIHGLWFNVIVQWNSSTEEEMCSTLVCLYACVCDCGGPGVGGWGQWITLALPTFGRGTLLVLSMREFKKKSTSYIHKWVQWICDSFLLMDIDSCAESGNSCRTTREHKQMKQDYWF